MHEKAPRVYLDHNATSPMRPEAVDEMARLMRLPLANPASLHAEGREARSIVEGAREEVAQLVGARAGEVVFTSGGSEAIAAAIRGVCDRAPRERRQLVVSAIEHSAVLAATQLATRRGFSVLQLPCDREGRVQAESFARSLGPEVALAALQWANNETGVTQPVAEVGRLCRGARIPFLVDAVQAAGKIAIGSAGEFVDLLALSAHKIGGPQGSGALIVRDGLQLAPLIPGGAEEMRRRGGTPGVALLAGFAAAARAAGLHRDEETRRTLRLRAKIETRLRELFPELRFHGQASPRLPNTVNFAIPGVPGELLTIALDLAGFAVSTGSACASGAVEPSHVIRAMSFDENEARAAVRVSLGWNTTPDEVDLFLGSFPGIAEQVRRGVAEHA